MASGENHLSSPVQRQKSKFLSVGANLILNTACKKTNGLGWPDGSSLLTTDKTDFRSGVTFRIYRPYSSYPVLLFSFPSGRALIEGEIYNVSLQEAEAILSALFSTPDFDGKRLQEITANWTGEWCLWGQKGSRLFIITDPLGRLPMYYYRTGGYFFIGRHLALLAENNLLQHDNYGTASFLWSGYLIGHRTLYKDVKRLPGGSLVQVDLDNDNIIISPGKQFNFEDRNRQPLNEQAEELAQLFLRGCKRIAETWQGTINISQSGGQDSRAVAAGFAEAVKDGRLIASSLTMCGSERDASLGKLIASTLHIPFRTYAIEERAEYDNELLANKMGMNYLGMAFIHDFYKKMLAQNGSFLYVTGDGGDKALPYLGEKNPNISLDRLVVQLSQRHAMTSLEKTAELTGLSTDELLHMIHETVSSYPEEKINNKSIHFTIYERGGQCLFEGEDRSRHFAWATTPFYDLDFFRAAMQVPDAYKKHYRLYRSFQNALNRAVADIPDASGHSINSMAYMIRKMVQEAFRSAPPRMKNLVRQLGGMASRVNKGTAAEHQQLLKQLMDFGSALNVLNINAVASFIQIANQVQYQHLRTLILLGPFLKASSSSVN
jgi:asparagine synthase (glutamine-hydrolysing)